MSGVKKSLSTFGHLAYVSKAPLAVVVLQEWWGLNDQIRGVCNRLQGHGYSAFAPDLYKGKQTLDEAEANHLMEGLDWDGACNGDIAAAVDLLRQSHARVAIMGFCMGGALALSAGTCIDGIDGVISYYGIAPDGIEEGRKLSVPFMGHFADQDGWITPAVVDALELQLRAQGARYTLHRYAADHAFANDDSDNFDSGAAKVAWERSLGFLKTMHTS